MYKSINGFEIGRLSDAFNAMLISKKFLDEYNKVFHSKNENLELDEILSLFIRYNTLSDSSHSIKADILDKCLEDIMIKLLLKYNILDQRQLEHIQVYTTPAHWVEPEDFMPDYASDLGEILPEIPCVKEHILYNGSLLQALYDNNENNYLDAEYDLFDSQRINKESLNEPLSDDEEEDILEAFENSWECAMPNVLIFKNIRMSKACEVALGNVLDSLTEGAISCEMYQTDVEDVAVLRCFDDNDLFPINVVLVIIAVCILSDTNNLN